MEDFQIKKPRCGKNIWQVTALPKKSNSKDTSLNDFQVKKRSIYQTNKLHGKVPAKKVSQQKKCIRIKQRKISEFTVRELKPLPHASGSQANSVTGAGGSNTGFLVNTQPPVNSDKSEGRHQSQSSDGYDESAELIGDTAHGDTTELIPGNRKSVDPSLSDPTDGGYEGANAPSIKICESAHADNTEFVDVTPSFDPPLSITTDEGFEGANDSSAQAGEHEFETNEVIAPTDHLGETPKRRGIKTNRNSVFPGRSPPRTLDSKPGPSISQPLPDDSRQVFLVSARLDEDESDSDASSAILRRLRARRPRLSSDSSDESDYTKQQRQIKENMAEFGSDSSELWDPEKNSELSDDSDGVEPPTAANKGPSGRTMTRRAMEKSKRAGTKRILLDAARPAKNKKLRIENIPELDEALDIDEAMEKTDEGFEKRRTPRNENRTMKQCSFCSYSSTCKLDRHIFRNHKKECGNSMEAAKRISKRITKETRVKVTVKTPIGRIKASALEETYGASWTFPGVKENTLSLMAQLNVEVIDDAPVEVADQIVDEPIEEIENAVADDESRDEDDAPNTTVKALMKTHGLYQKVPLDYIVIKKFRITREGLGKDPKALENTCKRLAQMFAYATREKPEKNPWELLVDYQLHHAYLSEAKEKCKISASTRLIYAKDMVCLTECARDRWLKHSEVPKTQEFKEDLAEAAVFWKDQQSQLLKLVKAKKRQNLTTGNEQVADLEKCFEYLGDVDVKEEIEAAFTRLESAQRFFGKLKITMKDTALREAWNSVIRFLIMNIIIQNGCRTGVLENMLIGELESAAKLRGKWIIYVAQHKRAEDGAAKVRVYESEFPLYERYLKLRKSMAVKMPHKHLLFVTIGGQPFRHIHEHINAWNKRRGYPAITTNMIRKGIQNAAAAQGMDIQTDVCSHLAHSLQTAENNYRSKDLDAAIRASDAVESATDNHRALRIATKETLIFFDAAAPFPSLEDLQDRFRERLQKPHFKMTAKTYSDINDVWSAAFAR